MKKLPKKIRGKHRFTAMATFPLSEKQAEWAAKNHDWATIALNQDNLLSIDAGCIDCETELRLAIGHSCPSPATEAFLDETEEA